jgi:hypothetical protein
LGLSLWNRDPLPSILIGIRRSGLNRLETHASSITEPGRSTLRLLDHDPLHLVGIRSDDLIRGEIDPTPFAEP